MYSVRLRLLHHAIDTRHCAGDTKLKTPFMQMHKRSFYFITTSLQFSAAINPLQLCPIHLIAALRLSYCYIGDHLLQNLFSELIIFSYKISLPTLGMRGVIVNL